jgi:hypothetical protein
VQTALPYSQSGGTIKRCGSDQPATCPCRSESRPPGAQHRCAPTIPHHSPFAVFQLAARCLPSLTIRDSPFAVLFHSPFAVFFRSPRDARPGRWVSTNGGSPTHPRTVGARHAAPRPLLTHGSVCTSGLALRGGGWAAGKIPAPQHNRGGSRTRPYLDQHHSPFAIRYSLFAVFFYSPFAVFHHPPLATRNSPLATRYSLRAARRLSPFAIRDSPFAVFHHSPLATRYSLRAARRLSPLAQSVRAVASIPDTFPSIAGTRCGRRTETRAVACA